jgi:hypothetical protein
MGFFRNVVASVREVNRRYAKPEIETTLFTRICLVSLRVYLMGMVALMAYALVHTAMTGGEAVAPEAQPAAVSQPAAPAPSP